MIFDFLKQLASYFKQAKPANQDTNSTTTAKPQTQDSSINKPVQQPDTTATPKPDIPVVNTQQPDTKDLKYKGKLTILLDPGHTDKTPGKCSPDKSLMEWKYNRIIVKKIEEELDKLGIEHWNSHPEDGWVSSTYNTDSKDLVLRCYRINNKYAELKSEGKKAIMISVHVNAASNGEWKTATGWSAWTTKGQNNSDKLADCLYDAAEEVLLPMNMKIRKEMSDGDRDYESNFYIIKKSNCVSVLTENFFQDNKSDVKWLLSEEGKNAITKLHIEGIKKYIDKYIK